MRRLCLLNRSHIGSAALIIGIVPLLPVLLGAGVGEELVLEGVPDARVDELVDPQRQLVP